MITDDSRVELNDAIDQLGEWASEQGPVGQDLIPVLVQLKDWVASIPNPRFCTLCMNWDKDNDVCKLFDATPPPNIILEGCDEFDDIPF